MFELESYDVYKESDKYVIKINIHNHSEEQINAKVTLNDSIFGHCYRERFIQFAPKTTHWVSWDLVQDNAPNEERGLQMQSLWGSIVKVMVNEEVVNTFSLKYLFTNLNLRKGLNNFSQFNKKKFWILGDSHAGYYTNISSDYLKTKDYDIVPAGLMALTLNNFLESDWEKWFNLLPIFDSDIVAFDIGEIDLRCGLFMASTKKNLELNSLTNELLKRYFDFLLYFKEKFKNKLVIIPSNRPIKDNCLTGNAEYYKLNISTSQQRVELWNNFNNQLKLFCTNNSIDYWDIKHMYTDKDGTLFNDVLYYNDIHIKVKEPMLFDLKYKIENNF